MMESASGNSALCFWNRCSIFAVMAIVQVLVAKMMKLYVKMAKPAIQDANILSHRYRWFAFLVPFVCCMCSFAMDSSENESFHLARAGVVCRMRFAYLWQGILLVHLPMIASVFLLVVYLLKCCALSSEIVSRAMVQDEATFDSWFERHLSMFASMRRVLRNRHVEKIANLSICFACVLLCWVGITVLSIPEFDTFITASDDWFRCIRFVFAREQLLGKNEWQTMREEYDGTRCPEYPDSHTLFTTQMLRLCLEVLVAVLIAKTFSWKVVRQAAITFWTKRARDRTRTDRCGAQNAKKPEYLGGVFPPNAACIESLGQGVKMVPMIAVGQVQPALGVDGRKVSMCVIGDNFDQMSESIPSQRSTAVSMASENSFEESVGSASPKRGSPKTRNSPKAGSLFSSFAAKTASGKNGSSPSKQQRHLFGTQSVAPEQMTKTASAPLPVVPVPVSQELARVHSLKDSSTRPGSVSDPVSRTTRTRSCARKVSLTSTLTVKDNMVKDTMARKKAQIKAKKNSLVIMTSKSESETPEVLPRLELEVPSSFQSGTRVCRSSTS